MSTIRRCDLPAPMYTRSWASLFVAVALIAPACRSTSTGGGGGSAGSGGSGPCTVDADCGASKVCGFPEAVGCSAEGRCFPAPGIVCDAYAAGCACDGTVINLVCNGLPPSYSSKPLAHMGACEGGCSGEYICLSTVPCTADADCAALGSTCDACTSLCGCGVPGGGS